MPSYNEVKEKCPNCGTEYHGLKHPNPLYHGFKECPVCKQNADEEYKKDEHDFRITRGL